MIEQYIIALIVGIGVILCRSCIFRNSLKSTKRKIDRMKILTKEQRETEKITNELNKTKEWIKLENNSKIGTVILVIATIISLFIVAFY